MGDKDLADVLSRGAAALETPGDLTERDKQDVIEDLRNAEDEVRSKLINQGEIMSEVIEEKKFDLIATVAGEVSGFTPEQAEAMIPRIKDIINTAMCNTFTTSTDFTVDAILEPYREPPTPEERADIEAYADKLGKESKARLDAEWAAKHATVHARDYAIAEKWAAAPNLSERERCHGLVWDIRHQEDKVAKEQHDKKLARDTTYEPSVREFIMPAPYPSAPGYSALYERQNSQEIKDNLMRSAADLFN